MAYTSHGHQIPGTPPFEGQKPEEVARCGGLGLCATCSAEAGAYLQNMAKELSSTLEFKLFVRKPFTVEALEITEQNMEEVAKFIGVIGEKFNGARYIQVDQKRIPNVPRVYPGYWMTRIGENVRLYGRRVFHDQFIEADKRVEALVESISVEEG